MVLLTPAGIHYAPNSWNEQNSSSLFENLPSAPLAGALRSELATSSDASFAVFGDLDNNGSIDMVSILHNQIQVYVSNGLGDFTPIVTHFSGKTYQDLDHAILIDLDTDGDEDLIVLGRSVSKIHIFENQSDPTVVGFRELGNNTKDLTNESHGIDNPEYVVASDIDKDGVLDLIVANAGTNEVIWYKNEGSLNFSFGGVVAKVSNPSCLEIIDLHDAENLGDPFACRDLLIGAKQGVFLAQHSGQNRFVIHDLVKEEEKEESGFPDLTKSCTAIKAIDLDNDRNHVDVVYLTDGSPIPYFVRQKGFIDFDDPEPFLDLEEYKKNTDSIYEMQSTSSLEVYRVEAHPWDPLSLPKSFVLAASNVRGFVWIFETVQSESFPIVFKEPSLFRASAYNSDIQNINFLAMADLDRRSNFVKFEISGGRSERLFDKDRIRSGGKLFFLNEPDYELPVDGSNNYYIKVTAYIENAGGTSRISQKEMDITIEVEDANDPPTIDYGILGSKQFPSTEDVLIIESPENVLIVLDEFKFTNQEVDQNVTFKISGGDDKDFFDIDPLNGRLSFWPNDYTIYTQTHESNTSKSGVVNFKYLPDFEDPFDANKDNIFEIIVEAVDDENGSDEQHVQIVITDAAEVPEIEILDFGKLNLNINEDESVSILDLASFVQSSDFLTFEIYDFLGLEHGSAQIHANSTYDFIYSPAPDFFGHDQVFIKVNNGGGALYCLAVEVEVLPLPDPPISLVTNPVRVPESKTSKWVSDLNAKDGDPDEILHWSLANADDPHFKVVTSTDENSSTSYKLYFDKYPDYEDLDAKSLGNVFTAELLLHDKDRVHEVEVFLQVVVENLPDSPPQSILSPNPALNVFPIFENNSRVKDFGAYDPDYLEVPTVAIVGGDDADHFEIRDGVLWVVSGAELDYESPKDKDKNNFYELKIRISDSKFQSDYDVLVEVLGVDEVAPYFVSGKEFFARENQTLVSQVIARDVDEPHSLAPLKFSIGGGTEGSFFTIDQTGTLKFREAQNFENPQNAQGINGGYQVLVEVSDGVHQVTQEIMVYLDDVNDAPMVNPSTFTLNEDESFTVDLNVIDEDGDSYELEFLTFPKHGSFSHTGKSFSYFPINEYYGFDSFLIKMSDELNSTEQNITIEILPVNDPPVAMDDIKYFYQVNRTSNPLILIDVLANDHTGPDDPSEKSSYAVEAIGAKSANGNNVNTWSRGVFRYIPGSSFMGEDSFEYRLIDNGQGNDGFVDTATVRVWVATTAKNPDWTNLMFFGMYYHDTNETYGRQNWIYHVDMGWVYVHKPDQLLESTWMWKENVGWFWTGDKYFKWVYHQGLQQWLHWEGGINSSSGWFLRTEQEVEDMKKILFECG